MGPNWELVSDVINSTLQFKVSSFFFSLLLPLGLSYHALELIETMGVLYVLLVNARGVNAQ
jgi:hypothetical protein